MLFFAIFICFASTLANEKVGVSSLIPHDLQQKMQAMVDNNPMKIIETLNQHSDPGEIRSVVAMLDKKLHSLEAQRDDIQRRQNEAKAEEAKEQAAKAQKIASAKEEQSSLSGLLGLISGIANHGSDSKVNTDVNTDHVSDPDHVANKSDSNLLKLSKAAPDSNSDHVGHKSASADLLGLLAGLKSPAPEKTHAKSGKSNAILALLPLLLKGLAA